MTLSTLIYQNAMTLFEWDTASVIAIIMILITYLVMKIIGVLANRMNLEIPRVEMDEGERRERERGGGPERVAGKDL